MQPSFWYGTQKIHISTPVDSSHGFEQKNRNNITQQMCENVDLFPKILIPIVAIFKNCRNMHYFI